MASGNRPTNAGFTVIDPPGTQVNMAPKWQELARSMSTHFRAAEFSEGIVQGIKRAGELLAEHFPRRPDDTNELPNRVERD